MSNEVIIVMSEKKKFVILGAAVLLFALFASAVCFPVRILRAEGAAVYASFDDKEYSKGDSVSIKIMLKDFPENSSLKGSVTVSLGGVKEIKCQGIPAEITPEITESKVVFSTGESSVTIAGGSLELFSVNAVINTDADASVSVSAALKNEDGSEVSVSGYSGKIKIKKAVIPAPETTVPTATASVTAVPSALPSETPLVSEMPSETPVATETSVPTAPPTPTLTVIETPAADATDLPPINTDEGFSVPPVSTPSSDNTPKNDETINPVSIGAVIFWSIVSLVAGIWIGILIGRSIWHKKSVFMTPSEKKIIGRY